MLIKSADDPAERIALLESLQDSPRLDAGQKAWARDELQRLRRGAEGARAAAEFLDGYLAESRSYAVLHDLRFAFGDDVAQIDHLLIGRTFVFYLLDTAHFSADLRIDERGEFTVRHGGGDESAIPSPLERSRRHERLLVKALETLGITGRVSARPTFHHIVLVGPQAMVSRPAETAFDTRMVMEAERFRGWHERHAEQDNSFASVLTGVLNVRAGETIEAWGRSLARLHRAAEPQTLPDFMQPKDVEAVAGTSPGKRRILRARGRKRPPEGNDEAALQRKLV